MVAEKEFIKRMGRYAQEGIRHFYFMMLQKDEVRLLLGRGCVWAFMG